MAVNNTLKYNQLTEILLSNDCNDSLVIEAMKSSFHPKALKNVFDYVRYGSKILKNFLLMENKENVQAAKKLLTFTKKQVRNAVTHGNSSKEKLWDCLMNLWESTKSLIEMDSNVDLSEFASWLLKSIIDFGVEIKRFSPPSKVFIIEENFSFIDDHLSGSPSLDIALKLKSVTQPKSRKYIEVIYPIARYIFKNQNKRSNIENFLKVALLAKIIFNKSRKGSAKANILLETFFMKAVLPPDFFSFAEDHMNMKKPEGKKMQRNRILAYILKQLNFKSTYEMLYRKDDEANFVNIEPSGDFETLETEMQIQKDDQCNNANSQQNNLKVNLNDSNVVISSSGPFLICIDKNSELKKIQNRGLNVNFTKNKTKPDENTKPGSNVILPLKYDIHSQDIMHSRKLSKTSLDGLKSSVGKESINSVEPAEEKDRKRKRRQKKNKNCNHDLEQEKPSKKQKNSDSNSVLGKERVHPCESQIDSPEKGRNYVDSKATSKNISTKIHPLVSNKIEGNWTVSDIETKNTSKPINLPNKGNKIAVKKCDKANIHRGNVIQKRNEKRERKKTLTHKVVTSNSMTYEHHDEASERNLNAFLNNDELTHSNKNVILNKLDASELSEMPCKKRRRKAKHSDKSESTGFQQSRIEPKVVHGLSNLKEKASKIIEEGKTVEKVNKIKESEVDEASGSDSDIVPNDLENSMFTKEETRAYHQLQLKELKENEKRQKMKVFFDKAVESEISNSVGKLETDKTEDKKNLKCLVDSQDIGLSSLYKKIDKIEAEKSFGKSDPQSSADEEVLPYGDDKIEDLEIVFSTIKKDLKTKFACNIKEELPSEEDSLLPVPVKETKPVKKRLANTESHPDNLFNIYSKNDDINIISCSKPKNYSFYNKVKLSVNSKTRKLTRKLNTDKQDLLFLSSELNVNDNKMPSKTGFVETDITKSRDADELESPSMISKNQLVLKEKKIEEDFVVNHDNSLIEASNVEVVCKDKQVCNDQQRHIYFDVSDEDENENAVDGLTISEIKILDSSQCNLGKSEDSRLHKSKEAVDTHTDDAKESEKSFTLNLDESSDDCSTNNSSVDNIKLSETKSIVKNMLNDEILKDNMETSTFESIGSTIENISYISKKITLEQRSDKENVENNDIDKAMTLNETDVSNVIPEKVSEALVITENSRSDIEILDQNTETPISENVEFIGENMCEASNEKSMKKNDQVNRREENPVDNILESKSPHRKALTFEVLENSSECRSEMSPLKLPIENEENSENKENIVNNKQEESVLMSSFVSSNFINEEFSKNENCTPPRNEPPKINMTKYKSPAKRKSLVENSPVSKKNIICLTPLKVANAALSNEIIISPDVSDEENTAKAINNRIEEENIIPSISESIVTLDQTSHEEEQIRDENEHSYSIDFRSREDKPFTKILKENYNFGESENFHNSPPLEILELSPVSIASSECKKSPNLSLVTDKISDLLQKDDQLKNSTISYVTKKSPLIRPKFSPDKNSSSLDGNNELASTGNTVIRKSKYSDNIETSKSELDNSVETQEEELESKDKVPSPIRTRYSLRRNKNIATPEKDIMKPVRRRRNSVSSVKSENEIEVLSSPSYKSRRSLTAGNLTPVRRSRRISELSVDKN